MEGVAQARPRGAPTSPWLSLSFFFTGFSGLLAAYAMLLVHADRVLLHYVLPEGVAITHITVLGWLSMVVMGALYQLMPVIAQADLASKRLATFQFVAYVLGVGGLIESFALAKTGSLPVHGSFAIAAVLLFLLNMGLTLRKVQTWSVPAAYLAVALGFLTATVTLGFIYALAKAYGWFTVELDLVAMHAHLGVAGWLSLILVGVSYRLFPMFTLARGIDLRLARWNLGLLAVSIAALAASLALDFPRGWTLAAGGAAAAGFALYTWDAYRMYRKRLRRNRDLYFAHVCTALLALLLTVVVGLLLAIGEPAATVREARWPALYAYLALGGWLTLAIMGHAYKIVPMLVWQARYRDVPSETMPLLADMYSRQLARLSLAVYVVGFACGAIGLAADETAILRAGAAIALAGAAGFTANMSWVLVRGLRRSSARVPVSARPDLRAGSGV